MAPDRKTLIGRTFPLVKFVIQEDDVTDYLRVMGEDHPAFQSDDGAQASGYDRRAVPPSFGPFMALRIIRSFDWEKDFFVDFNKGMPAILGMCSWNATRHRKGRRQGKSSHCGSVL